MTTVHSSRCPVSKYNNDFHSKNSLWQQFWSMHLIIVPLPQINYKFCFSNIRRGFLRIQLLSNFEGCSCCRWIFWRFVYYIDSKLIIFQKVLAIEKERNKMSGYDDDKKMHAWTIFLLTKRENKLKIELSHFGSTLPKKLVARSANYNSIRDYPSPTGIEWKHAIF